MALIELGLGFVLGYGLAMHFYSPKSFKLIQDRFNDLFGGKKGKK